MWEREDIIETARSLEVVPVVDVSRESPPSGALVYTRLRALGKTGSISAAVLDRMADRLRSRREVFLVVERPSDAVRVRTALTEALAKKRPRRTAPTIVRPSTSPQLIAEDEEQ